MMPTIAPWHVTLRSGETRTPLTTILDLTVTESVIKPRYVRLHARLTVHAPPEVRPAPRDWLLLERDGQAYDLMIDAVRCGADRFGVWYEVEAWFSFGGTDAAG